MMLVGVLSRHVFDWTRLTDPFAVAEAPEVLA
jgi:hypothetical protein